jgi:REP element-mobilizing transposase RayT
MKQEPKRGWRHWYHITLGTYGHWLPGDARGWCERHHRKHVPGTHAHPPPSEYGKSLNEYARRIMKRPPFEFDKDRLSVIGQDLLESLSIQACMVLAISVSPQHCHLLVQCVDDQPRMCSANLKNHVYHRQFKGKPTPWQKRSHESPIGDRAHGRHTFEYIMEHKQERAWVWSYGDRDRGQDHSR